MMLMYAFLLMVHGGLLVKSQWSSTVQLQKEINANFDQEYILTVSKGICYNLTYRASANRSVAIRVRMSAPSATKRFPVNFVLWEDEGVLSWRLPWIVEDNEIMRYSYTTVIRTICSSTQPDESERLYVIMNTLSAQGINATLELALVPIDLSLDENVNLMIEPVQAIYKRFTFPNGVESVVVEVKSLDVKQEGEKDVCMVLSVQGSGCPVNDLMRNVEYSGSYQTITKNGSITVPRSQFSNASFFVVLVVEANDTECELDFQGLRKRKPVTLNVVESPVRQKNVSIHIKEGLQASKYLGPTLGAAGVFVVLAFVLGLLYWGLIRFIQVVNQSTWCSCCPEIEIAPPYEGLQPREGETNTVKKNYPLNLLAVFIYYGIPVWQLVYTYTVFSKVTGNQDICYYNFACMRPLGALKAFNNVFSNIGYIIMGLAFIFLVTARKYIRRNRDTDLGVPDHYGLLYSIGLGLCIEGIMSGCYHVCPNIVIFQFDTSYMYMISWLCMLKLYQNRHPSLLIDAATAYVTIAVFVLLAVFGVLYCDDVLTFWIIFGIVHILVSFFMTNLVCLYEPTDGNVFSGIIKGLKDTNQSKYVWRLACMIIVTGINIALAIYSMVIPKYFASHLLYICVANLLMYMGYYLCMKMAYKERVFANCLFGLLTGIMWGVAIYMFTIGITSWKLSPAHSRDLNEDCAMLDFYDKHDIWHFCSAISLFMSFCFLLAVDDDLDEKDRDQIPIF